jgi:hypothetical protein
MEREDVRAVMLVDTKGKVLAHRRRSKFDDIEDDSPLVAPFPKAGLVVFLRLASVASANDIHARLAAMFSFCEAQIIP